MLIFSELSLTVYFHHLNLKMALWGHRNVVRFYRLFLLALCIAKPLLIHLKRLLLKAIKPAKIDVNLPRIPQSIIHRSPVPESSFFFNWWPVTTSFFRVFFIVFSSKKSEITHCRQRGLLRHRHCKESAVKCGINWQCAYEHERAMFCPLASEER